MRLASCCLSSRIFSSACLLGESSLFVWSVMLLVKGVLLVRSVELCSFDVPYQLPSNFSHEFVERFVFGHRGDLLSSDAAIRA